MVLILDNVPAHKSDFIFEVAEYLNIYLLYLPEYSPDLNPTEGAWNYSKLNLNRNNIGTLEELIDNTIKLFLKITTGDSLYKTYVKQYFPQLLWTQYTI